MSRRRLIATIGCLFIAVVSLTFWQWVVSPAAMNADEVGSVDAIVMFVGGRGERLDEALVLANAGVADVLVIPNGLAPEWPDGNEACRGTLDFEVLCPVPEPDNTRGEARAFGRLAEERGWQRIAAVTSSYHLTRAEHLLTACVDATVVGVAAESDLGAVSWLRRGIREWVANVAVRTIDRGC